MMKLPDWIIDPVKFRRVNGWATVLWFIAAFPICIYLAESIPFLVFVSVYAVVTGHLATWQSARVEARQEEDNTEQLVHEIKQTQEETKQSEHLEDIKNGD
jgi:flagellar biosynthesis component FlhA